MTGPVAIIAAGELFGGAERHVLGLGAFLRGAGLDPRVILFHDRELAARCRDGGLPVDVLPATSALDPAGPRRLGALCADLGVRLVHVHGYKAAANAALAPGRFAMVSTLHGQGEPDWRRPREFLRDRLYRNLEVQACRRRRAAVCFVTEDLRRRHGRRYGALPLFTVPNGIAPLEPEDYPQRPPDLPPDRLHAVMVGRLTPVKGIDLALAALAAAPPEVPWHLDVIGDGKLRDALEAQARELGVGDRVTFHGFRRDVYAVLAHSDLLVMSSHHEGLPYTLLEAMSLGLPTLASDVGGLAEVLRHEETGLLVPVGDVAGLAAALARLGRDAELRRRLGRNAALRQRRDYTLQAMGEGYLAAYRASAGTLR
ncbi:MAG TPA: glycosyltransferase family 4 protein [Candidatus Krumholzibacteria bacterium]|nr:glycosyltransferase family 4 protein [Candidatus Krumholzibacteria bacterium]HPD71994.1 glycosyltransferase family 4 protein [Candidatus Krumholzibacteria bacterium]HRY41073.1 glycosyltransferase family 4 protein [Candidatus Krumholzibacteria bacterium]